MTLHHKARHLIVEIDPAESSEIVRKGTKHLILAKALLEGATLPRLERLLSIPIKGAKNPWPQSTCFGALGYDMRKVKGFGISTTMHTGQEIWDLGFFETPTTWPLWNREHASNKEVAAALLDKTYIPEFKTAVYHLVLPKNELEIKIK